MKKSDHFVFDTNLVIRAFLFPKSATGRALDNATRSARVAVSMDTLTELTDVFKREKFNKYLPWRVRRHLLRKYEKSSLIFVVKETVALCRDPDDDKFLSLAQAASATAIVSGDKDLLVLKYFEHIPIVTPNEFLKMVIKR